MNKQQTKANVNDRFRKKLRTVFGAGNRRRRLRPGLRGNVENPDVVVVAPQRLLLAEGAGEVARVAAEHPNRLLAVERGRVVPPGEGRHARPKRQLGPGVAIFLQGQLVHVVGRPGGLLLRQAPDHVKCAFAHRGQGVAGPRGRDVACLVGGPAPVHLGWRQHVLLFVAPLSAATQRPLLGRALNVGGDPRVPSSTLLFASQRY